MVQTFTSSVASCLRVVYSVVVLPEPVGPVTRMMPLGWPVMLCQRRRSSAEKPSWSKPLSSTSGSKMRITSFSPKAVGRVDKRSSISPPSGALVLTRPSCGLRFSATFIRPRLFSRLTMAMVTCGGNW
ncbi:hypothetical protein D3C81_1719740 [compost metagenome]